MMFLLRCAFWLSIVYSSIFWSHGAFSWNDEGARVAEIARTGATNLMATAASRATEFCRHHAEECLADAARLTSLVRATEPDAAIEPKPSTTSAERAQVAESDVPLPIPDPRRHFRDAKHSRTP